MLTGRAVVADLGKSLPISLKLQRIVGVSVGQTLGQLLAELGQTEPARQVLEAARDACLKLDQQEPADQIAARLEGG